MAGKVLRVVIVDDHAIVREGLKSILAPATDLDVVGEASNAPDALNILRSRAVDLLLVDIGLPGRSGIELLKQVKGEFPHLQVLVLSSYPEDQYALRVVKQGAAGYLTKESAPELLISAIRKVAAGGKYISASLAERLFDEVGGESTASSHELLSDREFEVFKLIAAGKTLTEIAGIFHVSIKTISTHRSRILEKTGLRTNADITRYALERGLIQ